MGSILYTKAVEKGSFNYFAGTVSSVREPSGKKPFSISIRMALMNPKTKKTEYKTVSMSAWNNEKANRADRFAHMKIHKGSFVYGLCGDLRENKADKNTYINATLFALGYAGRMDIEDGDKKYILLSGRDGNINESEDGKSASFGLAVDIYDRENKENTTQWYNVDCAGAVLQRLQKTGRFKKGVLMAVLAQMKETKKETKNPVVTCLRFDFVDESKENK